MGRVMKSAFGTRVMIMERDCFFKYREKKQTVLIFTIVNILLAGSSRYRFLLAIPIHFIYTLFLKHTFY